jgi:hypothetical protein
MAAVPCARLSLQIQMSGSRSSLVSAAIAERVVTGHLVSILLSSILIGRESFAASVWADFAPRRHGTADI